MKKEWTEEERKAFGEKMKAAREKAVELPEQPDLIAEDQDLDVLKAQMKEVMETNALLKAALLGGTAQAPQGPSVSQGGKLVGEVEKYLVDPALYPDPLERLRKEARLAPLAFDYNYELTYKVEVSSYQTQAGIYMKEPKFTVGLRRIILDDQGNQTNRGYHIQNFVFHEDPQTAMILARENGIEIDQSDERVFLNEMRYLRVKDWLFNCFWPKKENPADSGLKEEVIGGQLVQVYTRSSIDSTGVDFDQINSKLRT